MRASCFAVLLLTVAAAAPIPANGQSFNIDFGSVFVAPSSSFGAAASQPGTWNNIINLGNTSNLLNLSGSATSVGLNLTATNIDGVAGPSNNDVRLLKGDNFFSDNGNNWSFTLSGLADGSYT